MRLGDKRQTIETIGEEGPDLDAGCKLDGRRRSGATMMIRAALGEAAMGVARGSPMVVSRRTVATAKGVSYLRIKMERREYVGSS